MMESNRERIAVDPAADDSPSQLDPFFVEWHALKARRQRRIRWRLVGLCLMVTGAIVLGGTFAKIYAPRDLTASDGLASRGAYERGLSSGASTAVVQLSPPLVIKPAARSGPEPVAPAPPAPPEPRADAPTVAAIAVPPTVPPPAEKVAPQPTEARSGATTPPEPRKTPAAQSVAAVPATPVVTTPIAAVAAPPPQPPADRKTHQAAKKLSSVRSGDSKERIFELFPTVFVKQGRKIEKIDGIRLRVSGRSSRNSVIEVGEVVLVDSGSERTPYWFLFEDGRLLEWGKPDQWGAAAARHHFKLNYTPPGLAPGHGALRRSLTREPA
jgi:hypothetical protein